MVVVTNTVIFLDAKTKEEVNLENVNVPLSVNGELNFSQALAALSKGWKIARKSWNGPNQYVTQILPGNAMHQGFPMQPCLGLRNSRMEMQPGWVPSQGDLFAEDWFVI